MFDKLAYFANFHWSHRYAEDVMLKLIALCHYHLYSAFYIMDHQDLLLSQAEADDTCPQLVH